MDEELTTAELINGILKGLVIAGMAGSIIVAPNLVLLGGKALEYLDKRGRKLKDARVMYHMRRRNLVEYRRRPDGTFELQITKQGLRREQKLKLDTLSIRRPDKWDRKWRLVLFDIPEVNRRSRTALSTKLRELKFFQLQKSAWLHPFPCGGELDIIKKIYAIPESCIILTEIDNFVHGKELRKLYNL